MHLAPDGPVAPLDRAAGFPGVGCVGQRDQPPPRLDQALVGVDAPPVHHGPLVEEEPAAEEAAPAAAAPAAPEAAPLEEPLSPEVGLAQRLDVHEVGGVGVVVVHGGSAAGLAAPPLRARLRPAVALHLGPARGACRIIHGHSSEPDDFFAWFTAYHLG